MEPLRSQNQSGESWHHILQRNVHSVEREDDGGPVAIGFGLELMLEVLHRDDRGHEGTIITVGAGAISCQYSNRSQSLFIEEAYQQKAMKMQK